MGTSMVGEKGMRGEYEDGLDLNSARRFAVARERTSLIDGFTGGVIIEEVEEEEEAELESCGGEG